jgi:hypothetical protein
VVDADWFVDDVARDSVCVLVFTVENLIRCVLIR